MHFEGRLPQTRVARFNLSWLMDGEPTGDGEVPIKPAAEQTVTLRGEVTEENGVRSITGTRESFEEHNNHGPMTYYNVPFNDGAFSCSLKLEEKNYLILVFDGKGNGKATHAFKVYINGGPNRNDKADTLTLLTYDGSTKKKRKRKLPGTSITLKQGSGTRPASPLKTTKRLLS
jgi:hypothetical protein